jgi:hypothetical protein
MIERRRLTNEPPDEQVEGLVLYVVSSDMFDNLKARAREVAEEMWRRYLFDNPNMNPQVIELVRPKLIDMYMTKYIKGVSDRVHEHNKGVVALALLPVLAKAVLERFADVERPATVMTLSQSDREKLHRIASAPRADDWKFLQKFDVVYEAAEEDASGQSSRPYR